MKEPGNLSSNTAEGLRPSRRRGLAAVQALPKVSTANRPIGPADQSEKIAAIGDGNTLWNPFEKIAVAQQPSDAGGGGQA